jgi:xanthine/uracil permease
VLAATLVVFRLGGPLPDVRLDKPGRSPHPLFSLDALKAAGMGVLVLPIVWLVAQSPMKGQVIGAVFVGAMAAGAAGRLISPNAQPILLFFSPVLFGVVGCVIGAALLKAPLEEAFVADAIPSLLLPMPADYATGSLMGVAVGLGLVKSHIHHEED